MAPSGRLFQSVILAIVVGVAAAAFFSDDIAVKATPKGNAAWLYPETQQQIAAWKQQLTSYNQAAGPQRAIRVLYVYSMDFDVSVVKPVMGKLTQAAAVAFRTIPYVTHIGAIVDGYSGDTGNLKSLTTAKIQSLADSYARLYCASAALDGLQLDIEPYSAKYKNSTLTFLRRLSQDFRDTAFCAKPKFLTFFVGPRQAEADMYGALGPNGFTVISGYDLDSPSPGYPETPQQYQTNLLANLKIVKANAALSKYGKYQVGLPFAASACEFQSGISTKDETKIIQGYPMYDAAKPTNSYVPIAFSVLRQVLGTGYEQVTSPFLGVSVWAWVSRDVTVIGYRHTPKNPFDTPGMADYMAKNMPPKNLA